EYEILRDDHDEGDETIHTGRIVPIYEKAGTLTPRIQRSLIHRVVTELPADVVDRVPESVRHARQLMGRRQALISAHFPPEGTDLDALNGFRSDAQRRLIVEEFFLFQAGVLLRRAEHRDDHKARPVVVDDRIRASARRVLPFK